MDCTECGFRSAVGYCIACQKLLCEECGMACDGCGKLVCAEHVHETRRGKHLCPSCQEERRARKEERRGHRQEHEDEMFDHSGAMVGGTSFSDLQQDAPAFAMQNGAPVEISAEALVQSGHQKWQPWQFSMLSAILGLAAATIILVFPSLRGMALRSGGYVPSAYFIVFLPILSFVWAFVGLTYAKFWEDREKCLWSSGLGIVCIIMLFGGLVTDPVRHVEEQAEIAVTRDNMTVEELDVWRKDFLSKYQR